MAFSPFSLGPLPDMQTQQVRRPPRAAPADATDLADYLQTYGGTNTTDWSSAAPTFDKLGIGLKAGDGSPGWEFQDYGLGTGGSWGISQDTRNKLAGYKVGRDTQNTGRDARSRAFYDPQGNVLGQSAEDTSTSNFDKLTDLGAQGLILASGAGAMGAFSGVGAASAAGEAGATFGAPFGGGLGGAGAGLGELTGGLSELGSGLSAGEFGTAGALEGAAGGGALGLEGASYALPGAENGFSLANTGVAAEGAPVYTTAAADSQAAHAAMASGEIASPTLTAGASVPSAMNLGSAGGLMQTGAESGGFLGRAAGGIGSALASAGKGVSDFVTENPSMGSLLKGGGAALGAGLAQKLFGGNPPTAPSASSTIAQQSQANLQTAQQQAQLNRVDTTTPFGFQKFGQVADPSVPGGVRYTQDIGFSPQQQALYDSETSNQLASQKTAQGMQGRVADAVANPFSLAGTPAAEGAMKGDAFSSNRDAVTKSLFDRLTRLRGPQMAQEKEALDTKLRNQGLMPGTVAYDNGMRSLTQAHETELSDQADRALLAGGAEQTRLQTDSRASAGFNNQNRSQGIQEQLLQRQQPLSEYNAFRTGNTPTLPTFQPFGMSAVSPTNTMAASNNQYQSQADAYNAQIAKLQSLLNLGTTVAKGG